jgi:hypothetical protein
VYTWYISTSLVYKLYLVVVYTYTLRPFFAVASCNNDRTVSSKAYAWRLLGMMPATTKTATVAQTTEWRAEWRTLLYHSCIDSDIIVQQINDLTGRDIHTWYMLTN